MRCLVPPIWIALLLVLGCAPKPSQSRDASPATQPAVQHDEASAERGVAQFRRLRQSIDRAGLSARCDTLPSQPTETAWLRAWCAHRRGSPETARAEASVAAEFFEDVGEFRRAAEMWLLAAAAGRKMGEDADSLAAIRRAEELIDWARLSLRGDLRDPYASDLAYLEGYLRRHGDWVRRSPVASAVQVLEAADGESRSVEDPFARAHILRELSRAYLDAGRVDRALQSLSNSVAIDSRFDNVAGQEASIELAAELAERLGVHEVREWSEGQPMVLADEVLPGAPHFDAARRLRVTDAGRRKLADMIAAYRRSPEVRLQGDATLLATLRDPETLRYTQGRSWKFALNAGLVLRDAGDTKTSRSYLESAVETIETTRVSIPDAALRQRFFEGKRIAYESLVEHYVGIDTTGRSHNDISRALGVANGTKARGLLDLLQGTLLPSQTLSKTSRWETASTTSDRAAVLQSHLRSWIGGSEKRAPPPLRPFDGLSSFAPPEGAVFLEYLIGPRAGFVFVVGDDTLEVRRLSGARALRPRVDAFVSAVRDPSSSPERVRRAAERLYVDLIGPVQDLIVDTEHLIVALDEVIADVPFAALARPGVGGGTRWLVADHAISYVPSLAVGRKLASRPLLDAKGALVLGDPELSRSALPLAALALDPAAIAFEQLDERFPPLPGARREVGAISGWLPRPRTVLRGRAATEDRIVERSGALEVLHLAAHGVSDGTSSGLAVAQPAILLSRAQGSPRDGILTLEEILQQRPQARLVTLSGCETGVGWQTLGDGAFGLAGAFLFAGSEAVVASSWEVEDDVARRMMSRFYSARSRGAPVALRRAQLEQSRRSSPFYWASFRVYGIEKVP